jgi:hypothetical protein
MLNHHSNKLEATWLEFDSRQEEGSLGHCYQTGPRTQSVTCPSDTVGKVAEEQGLTTLPSNAKVKNFCSCVAILLYVIIARSLIKDSDNDNFSQPNYIVYIACGSVWVSDVKRGTYAEGV